MIFKHNGGRTWKYRTLAMTQSYRLRIHGYTMPAPLYTPAETHTQDYTNRPDPDWIGAVSPDDDDDSLMAVGVLA
jgi:hypothetical protein